MSDTTPSLLRVAGRETEEGISINVEGNDYVISFPDGIWKVTPPSVRRVLVDNLTYANTHFLPLMLGRDGLEYKNALPIFESFLYRNQLYDLTYCEWVDGKKVLTYLKHFYNMKLEFGSYLSAFPDSLETKLSGSEKPSAILPFSFGKESMLTFALCKPLGIEPVLVYTEEPTQPYEGPYKRLMLKKLKEEFGVSTYMVGNEPGTFRYGEAFKLPERSDLGWAAQTTMLSLIALPFAYHHRAKYILYGTEHTNNDIEETEGWNIYPSFDQTELWTAQQSNMSRLVTGGFTEVHCFLEPLEELHIFHMLHTKYPAYGHHQFSCFASKPLYADSQWCHRCAKCARNFLYAVALGIDPSKVGFKENLLNNLKAYDDYFDSSEYDYDNDMDYALYILYSRGDKSTVVKEFERVKKPPLRPFAWYADHFSTLKSHRNMPPEFEHTLLEIFRNELTSFAKAVKT